MVGPVKVGGGWVGTKSEIREWRLAVGVVTGGVDCEGSDSWVCCLLLKAGRSEGVGVA